jgi:putative DNA primase/helicase
MPQSSFEPDENADKEAATIGMRKSTVDKYFTKAIRQYELEQIELSKPVIKEYESDLSIWTQKRNGLLTKIKNHKPSHPPIFELEKQLKSLDKAKPIKPMCTGKIVET